MLQQYFQDIFNTTKTGDATEESYYPDLKRLIENWGKKKAKTFYITPLPKRTEAGNPDFRIWDGKNKIIGYIEAKDPKIENLDSVETTEQLKRYRDTFPNLILTNFFEFRLYREGQLIDKVSLGRPFIMHKLQIVPPVENENEFIQFLEKFFAFSIPKTTTAKALAMELAKRTRFLRDNVIAEELKEEKIEGRQILEEYWKAFKDHLIASLTLEDFSNLFAQTITYGLFAARSRAENEFNRELAYKYIPPTVGILRNVFRFISSTDLPKSMEWIVDDIAEVLASSDVKKIMENFYKEGKGHDPIIHFYETFLSEYDPKEREKRGVYYTPEPVVSYIVRSIHKLLKEKFSKEDGFATQSVTVLDPAAGTLTFPAEAIHQAIVEYKNKYGDGGINSLIRDHILKNFYAFELMMASYAIGHLKIGFIFDEYGYKLSDSERFNLFLTNTLDFSKEDPNQFPGIFERTISKESQDALKVKEEIPIMVVMGNPPYSVSSTNIIKEGSEFHKFYESYKELVRKEERNIQPLSDDYIKFIAFAHWKIKKAGQGIIGMITNNSYLDGLIHRDMRKKLLEDFDEIYILNLHGNVKRQEETLEGRKDENVFDIQQGVSIILLIKKKGLEKQVKYTDLWGLRTEKYKYLEENDVISVPWQKIQPQNPHNRLSLPLNVQFEKIYEMFLRWEDIFLQSSSCITTGNDSKIVGFNEENLLTEIRYLLNFNETKLNRDLIKNYAYKPFDNRLIYYDTSLIQRPRIEIMKQMLLGNNQAILLMRKIVGPKWEHALITNYLADKNFYGFQSYIFPMYLYDNQQTLLLEEKKLDSKITNFNENFLNYIDKNLIFLDPVNRKISYEEIFSYIYSILYSNIYRKKYQEFLKIDFPRIPFTKDYKLFRILASLGAQLVQLHLLKMNIINESTIKFKGDGDNIVHYIKFQGVPERMQSSEFQIRSGLLYINENQYFGILDKEVWEYKIGGYQILEKWLKDRKGKTLLAEDIKHYCKIATTLAKTIIIQKQIDELYLQVEETL